MPLDAELGKTMLQLITSRYDDRHWRKKIEKTLGLPQSGVGDPAQQQIFMYLKIGLKAYKSRRADPDSWIIGGYATKEVIERAKFQPQLVGADVTKDDVAFLGSDPGKEIDETWWDEMLVSWFDVPEEEKPAEEEAGERPPTQILRPPSNPRPENTGLRAPARVKPHGPSLLGSANLFRPGISSERNFEQCVSPSPSATASKGPCDPRRSQLAPHPQ